MLALMAGYRTGGGWYKQNEATQNSLSVGSVDHGEILVHSCVKSFQWRSGQAGLSGWYDGVPRCEIVQRERKNTICAGMIISLEVITIL